MRGGTDLISLEYKNVKPVYMKIEDYLISLINAKAFLPGDELPSVRQMASKNAVNPVAIHQALDSLIEKGYIKRVDNRYVVSNTKNSEEIEVLLNNLDQIVAGLLEKNYPIEDITDRIRGKECTRT